MRRRRPSAAPFPPHAVRREGAGAHRFSRIAAALVLTLALIGIVAAFDEARAAQLTASWIDNSAGTAVTRLERRSTDDPAFKFLADVPAGVTRYVDVGLSPGRIYCYRVAAYDGAGVSAYSNEACGKTAFDPSFRVTVKKTGDGTGTVVGWPPSLSCGGICSSTYSSPTVVTLIATPDMGSTFVGWSGGPCTGTASCAVAGNIILTATFHRLGASTAWGQQGSSPNPVLDAINEMLGAVAPLDPAVTNPSR
jgi:hypothetical protein